MTQNDGLADRSSQIGEKIRSTWEYHQTLEERKQEAMAEDDDVGAAYLAGQQSGLVHGIDVLEGLLEDDDA